MVSNPATLGGGLMIVAAEERATYHNNDRNPNCKMHCHIL